MHGSGNFGLLERIGINITLLLTYLSAHILKFDLEVQEKSPNGRIICMRKISTTEADGICYIL